MPDQEHLSENLVDMRSYERPFAFFVISRPFAHVRWAPPTTRPTRVSSTSDLMTLHSTLVVDHPHCMHDHLKKSGAKTAVDKAWEKLERLPALLFKEGKEQEEGHSGSTKRVKNSPFCYADGHLSSQECGS